MGDEIVTNRNDRRLVTSGGGWVRNGDRWQVLVRQSDDSVLVEDLAGRGKVALPGDYVRHEVALAYAVTIHKAQGLTVDRSILLVDDRTTAEGLYVGMTRGRASNMALAVCVGADAEHRPPRPARSETEVVLAAMGRSVAEVAALEALREAFARSESLATLAPRLANLNAWLAKETPPDRSRELQWVADGPEHARRHGRPGSLTRTGRQHAASGRSRGPLCRRVRTTGTPRSVADRARRHPGLPGQAERRRGRAPPRARSLRRHHPARPPGQAHRSRPKRGLQRPTALDQHGGPDQAYCEEWGVAPERLEDRPGDACQEQAWDAAVHTAQLLARVTAPAIERGLDRGLELGW